jgi:hypothetical protein
MLYYSASSLNSGFFTHLSPQIMFDLSKMLSLSTGTRYYQFESQENGFTWFESTVLLSAGTDVRTGR